MSKYGNGNDVIKSIRIGNIIFIIFICLSISGIIANKFEKDYKLNVDKKGLDKAHNIRVIVLTISLLIYIYFLYTRVSKKITTNTILNNLEILASILFVIGGLIFLYTEYKGDEEQIILE